MTVAGDLRHRVAFGKRENVNPDYPNDYGNVQSAFVEQFQVAAAVQARFGGETVQADRLQGQQTYTITVRQSAQTRLVATDWMVKDFKSGVEMAIKSGPVDPDDGRKYFEFLCQSGVVI